MSVGTSELACVRQDSREFTIRIQFIAVHSFGRKGIERGDRSTIPSENEFGYLK